MAFDFTFFETIDSTSSEAMRRIEGGVNPPFVIAARSQTSGRGRRGKSWSSPKGGIYLSIALPIENLEALSRLSIEAGVAVALWLEKTFGITPTLKWPNDIYVEARKLSGILSESALIGQSIKGVVVGIGINLHPFWENEENKPLSNPRIALSEIVGAEALEPFEKDFESSLKLLAGFLIHSLNDKPYLRSCFYRFDTSQGFWLREGLKFKDLGIDADNGNLNLKSLSTGETISLSSVNHDFEWWPLSSEARLSDDNLVIADLGNSSLKLWKREDSLMVQIGQFERSEELATGSSLELKNKVIAIGVVGENDFLGYSKVLEDAGAAVWRIKKRTVRVNLQNYDLNQIGIDRLALMEGYLKKKRLENDSSRNTQDSQFLTLKVPLKSHSNKKKQEKPNIRGIELTDGKSPLKGAILVSAGTATTIDIIESDGKYLGGLIMPGLQTSFIAMHASTSLLPLLDATEIFAELQTKNEKSKSRWSSSLYPNSELAPRTFYWQNPRGTSEAMAAGVYSALNGTLALVQSQLKALYPDAEFECVCCGGFAKLLEGATIEQDLIPLGLSTIAIG